MQKIGLMIIGLLAIMACCTGMVQAQASKGTTTTVGDQKQKVFTDTLFGDVTANQYFYRMYIWAVSLAVLAATAMVIRAGYIYTAGQGNPSAISSAKEMIINTMVGLALLVLSYTILRFIIGARVQTPSQSINQTQSR